MTASAAAGPACGASAIALASMLKPDAGLERQETRTEAGCHGEGGRLAERDTGLGPSCQYSGRPRVLATILVSAADFQYDCGRLGSCGARTFASEAIDHHCSAVDYWL